MKIVFIEPKPSGLHIFSRWSAYIPRLGSVLLATILKQAGHKANVFIEAVSKIDWDKVFSADVVMLSTITSTAPGAYYCAKRISDRGIPVVLGGPHPTALPDEALKYADFAVRGEGEEVVLPLVKAIETGKGFENIKGLSYKLFGKIIHNSPVSSWCDLDDYPAPDFSLVDGWTGKNIVSIQTSRGCPFGCKFCSVTATFGRKMRYKTTERVIEEIKANLPCRHIFFCDDNFTANKERAKNLLKRIIEEKLNIEWSCQIRVDAAKDEELVSLMKKAGCFTVCIGMESINPESLKESKKAQTVEDIIASVRMFHRHKIRVYGMFVAGFDSDTIKTIRQTVKFVKKEEIDLIQIAILTPLPGTATYSELKAENRLLPGIGWDKYDGHYVVFRPENILADRLQIEAMKASARFYSWQQVVKKLLKRDWWGVKIRIYGHFLSRKWQNHVKSSHLKILKILSKISAKN
ncbi:MAG: radical SAM protein [Patescibacteria group bacterium]